ncbi:MAG: SH3 domain-containing protein, partial [Thermomicrobiales bacterium]
MPLMTAATRAADTPTPPIDYPLFGIATAARAVEVRSCPGKECPVIFTIPLGESLRITGPAENGWLPISRDGAPGFAHPFNVQIAGAPAPILESGPPGCMRVAFLFNLGVGFT